MKHLAAAVALATGLAAYAQDEGQRNRLIVHEWGTFTAVYGADGTMLDWKPLVGWDLPNFVYAREKAPPTQRMRAYTEKRDIRSYERMETPVLYFYADREMVADVSVGFPKGLITEWYPQVREFRPWPGDGTTPMPVANGLLRWGKVRLFPQEMIAPVLPREGEGNHYYHARETDSAYVRVCGVGDDYRKSEYEKFLFYRGVGNFALPLEIRNAAPGQFALKNPTGGQIGHVFVLTVKKDGKGKYLFLPKMGAGESREVTLDVSENWLSKEQLVRRIGEEVEECLVQEGLFRKEARSMVKTWTDTWFEAEGTRVLYFLPEAMTNELLPLTIEPKPVELKRVLVARVDIMTPEQSKEMQAHIVRLGNDDPNVRAAAEQAIARLGRFAEPALAEAARVSQDPEIRARAADAIVRLTTVRR